MVKNIHTGKSRGYAFIEFEHERDMHGELIVLENTILSIFNSLLGRNVSLLM